MAEHVYMHVYIYILLQQLLDLRLLANSRKGELLPQKKFAFRSRKKEAPQATNLPDGLVSAAAMETKNQSPKKKIVEDISKVMGNKVNENLEMTVSQ